MLDESRAAGVTDENVQARLRALVLAGHVNRQGGLLLNTSNKTELSLGYGTLYGDLAGTLSVIGDLTKTEVYSVARWCSAERHAIPSFILERTPSAELKAGQVDPFDYETFRRAFHRGQRELCGLPPSTAVGKEGGAGAMVPPSHRCAGQSDLGGGCSLARILLCWTR